MSGAIAGLGLTAAAALLCSVTVPDASVVPGPIAVTAGAATITAPAPLAGVGVTLVLPVGWTLEAPGANVQPGLVAVEMSPLTLVTAVPLAGLGVTPASFGADASALTAPGGSGLAGTVIVSASAPDVALEAPDGSVVSGLVHVTASAGVLTLDTPDGFVGTVAQSDVLELRVDAPDADVTLGPAPLQPSALSVPGAAVVSFLDRARRLRGVTTVEVGAAPAVQLSAPAPDLTQIDASDFEDLILDALGVGLDT